MAKDLTIHFVADGAPWAKMTIAKAFDTRLLDRLETSAFLLRQWLSDEQGDLPAEYVLRQRKAAALRLQQEAADAAKILADFAANQ